jgi:PilZ domain
METDRRHAGRKRLAQLAYIRIGADNGGLIADLGEGGLGFQTIAAIEREGPLRFWFTLDAADRIQATGEMAWTDESRKVGGLRFTQISKEALQQIRDWMGTGDSDAPEPQTAPRQPARDPLQFSTPPRKAKPTAIPTTSSPIPEPPIAIAPPPPAAPIPRPEPLRVMATTQHWPSTPVLSAPPRGVLSPEMVRGATTGLTVLAVVLTIVALVFGFHRELGQSLARFGDKLSGQSPLAEAAPAPASSDAAATDLQPPPPAADPGAAAKPAPSAPQPTEVPAPAMQQPAPAPVPLQNVKPQGSSTIPARRSPFGSGYKFHNLSANNSSPGDNGQIELETAQQFLGTSSGAANYTEAAKWLWMSVEKGNPKAEVLLAGMFIRGDGVTRNCTQARVLLAAAIRQGNQEAGPKLRLLSEYGCR